MRLRIKDDVYEVDEGRISVKEARTFKRHTDTTRDGTGGMGAYQLREGLMRGDPDVMVFLMWLAKTRAGEKVTWSSFDDYDLVDDAEILSDDEIEDREPEPDEAKPSGQGRPDPTQTSGKTQKTASTTTSRRSRSASGSTPGKSTN